MKVKISNIQKDYLINYLLRDNKLLSIFSNLHKENKTYTIDIADDVADAIRDLCCDRLDRFGYDEDYELSQEGIILEALIDLFCVN